MVATFNLLSATLRLRAQQSPDEKAFTYLLDGADGERSVTYAELDRHARSIASWLQAEGMAGKRVLLLYVPGLDFIVALYGCLYAGAVAVPAYAPDPTRLARTLPRLRAIVQDCDVQLVLTTSPLVSMADALLAHAPDLAAKRWVASDSLTRGDGAAWVEPAAGADDVALLQYTSGSTSVPKGVVVSHRSALANLHMIREAYGLDEQTRLSMWVPFYHDMGLIGGILLTPFLGGSIVVMSPLEFIKRPLRWLRTFHTHRATMSWITNFALDLCARKIPPAELSGLDLSSCKTMVVGAEPVRQASLQRFVQAFEPYGFRPGSLFPSYGLAEAVLLVSGGRTEDRYRVRHFSQEALGQGRALPCEAEAKDAQAAVSCGMPVPGERIEVVDPETGARCPPGRIGEIWIAGPNVAQGYWKRREELGLTFQARLAETGEEAFLRTGDLGFLHEGELYIAARLKDLIILRGRNIYPQDIELTVEECHPRVRPSCTAAFAIDGAHGEALAIVAEVATGDLPEEPGRRQQALDEVIAAIVRSVGEAHEVEVSAVALIQARSIAKTSSGKIQRKAAREGLLKGELAFERRWEIPKSAAERDYLAPRTPTEEALSDLWKDVLGVQRVGVHDSFLAIGGQSILATEIVTRLRPLFGVELPQRALFEASTIAELAKIIEGLTDPSRMEEVEL